MDFLLEVFPGYNPLPKLVDTFKLLEPIPEIEDKEIVLEVIHSAFEEAGVMIETPEEMASVIGLLIEYEVLVFVEGPNGPYLISNPKFKELEENG